MTAAPQTQSFLSPDGVRIAFHVWGDPSDAPVLLHHGFAAETTTNWVLPGVVGRLLGIGRNVVSIDARGHGASEKPHDPAKYGHEKMAADVRALITHIGAQRVDLMGYSMGGFVSLHVATAEPRLRSLVVGGVGGGGGALGGPALDRSAVADAFEAAIRDPATRSADDTARQFVRFASSTGADLRALAANLRAVSFAAIPVASISVPTLVITGIGDLLAAGADRLAAAIPGARHVITPGDHLSAIAQPEFLDALTEWAASR